MSGFLFSEDVIIYLQSFGNPFIDFLFRTITEAGSYSTIFFLATLIFWCYDKKLGLKLMYVILISATLAILAKNLFKIPRPTEVLHKISPKGYGFPSGHALVSSAFWGYLCLNIRRWMIFVFIVLSISVSRIYLGVHYVGDVIGGIFFGLAIAFVFYKAEMVGNKEYIIVPVLILLLLHPALSKEEVVIGLLMISIGVGYLLEEKYIMLEDAKNNRQRIKRAFAGILILGTTYIVSMISPFFVYAMLGFASTFVAPLVFVWIESYG